MAPRTRLQSLLESFTPNVYFQPPTNAQIKYPCIVYKRDFADKKFADDNTYDYMIRYAITVIDQDPDSDIPSKVAMLPLCLFNRHYTVDNLNHDVFNVYY
jgi:hypothetical protein